jgi:hypothetical protein
MTPGQVLSLAKGNASPQAVDAASQAQAKRVPALLDPNKSDDKGFFERNIFDKVKETTRWSFAALDTIKDLAPNVASQIFSPNDPAGFDGWFQSTSLGTMLSDSEFVERLTVLHGLLGVVQQAWYSPQVQRDTTSHQVCLTQLSL